MRTVKSARNIMAEEAKQLSKFDERGVARWESVDDPRMVRRHAPLYLCFSL
jgi:hypothetical protein